MDCGVLILTPTPTLDPSRAPSSPEGCSSGMRSQRRPQLLFLRGSLPSPQPPGRASQGRTDEGDSEPARMLGLHALWRVPRCGPAEGSRAERTKSPRTSKPHCRALALASGQDSVCVSLAPSPQATPPPPDSPAPSGPAPPGCQARVLFCWRVSCLGFLEAGAAASSVGRTQVPCGKLGFAPLGLILSRSISISQAFTMFPFKVSV